jgi:two-component system phosphate regulon sensor histidine kinase PhoR
MNRRIKQVWLLAILSSFLLIGLQTYWLYNSVTYSMGEMGKKNAEKAEQAIVTYQTNIGAAVKEKSHIGYVVTAYFSDYKSPCTTVCSPLDTDTIIGGVVYSKPGFGNVMEKRDTFDLRETDSNNSFDCLNTYITYQLTRFDKAHFDRFISKKLGNDFIGAEMKTGKHRLWQTRIVEPPTLFHHEMLVEVPFNPIQYQSMQMRMQVPMLPILKGMMWQMIGSLLVTIMLLLSIAYLIKVMLLQKKVDKMRSDFVHTMIHELKRPVQTLKMCVSVFSAQKINTEKTDSLKIDSEKEDETDEENYDIRELSSYTLAYDKQESDTSIFAIKGMKKNKNIYELFESDFVDDNVEGITKLTDDVVITCTVTYNDGTSESKDIMTYLCPCLGY